MVQGAQPIQPGELIGGKYRVEKVLGQGGMAVVVAARHQDLDELVAIKILLPHRAEHPDVRARFAREARAAAKIKSEHVARVSDVGALADGTPYMVMEYLEGDDLASVLRRRGKLPETETILYALQICDALREAHSLGIVHRDIKPANLFLAKSRGRPPRLKVLDFGISKVERHDRTRTETKEVLGSPWYMAPEHLQSAHSADARSDIWSLGIILYEFVTGEVPFDGESMTEVIVKVLHEEAFGDDSRPELPVALEPIIRRCLAKDAAERFQSIDDLAMALRALERPRATDVRSSGNARFTPTPPSGGPRPQRADKGPVLAGKASEKDANDASDANDDDGEVVDVLELLPTPVPFGVVMMPAPQPSEPESTTPAAAVVVDARTIPTERPPRKPQSRSRANRDRLPLLLAAAVVPLGIVFAVVVPSRSGREARSTARPVPAETSVAVAPADRLTTVLPAASSLVLEAPPTPATPPPPASVPLPASAPPSARIAPEIAPAVVPAPAVAPPSRVATARPEAVVARAAARAPANVDAPRPAAVAPGGDGEPAVGFQVARRNHAGVRDCWLDSAKTTNLVTVSLSVDPSGAVSSASATASDALLARCVETKARTWTFPGATGPRSFRVPIRIGRN